MAEVSIRELRNHGGEVVDRAAAGEPITITRSGRPVARLTPVDRPPLPTKILLERWRNVPAMDPDEFRADIDAIIDPRL